MTVRWRSKISQLQDFSEPLQLFLLLIRRKMLILSRVPGAGLQMNWSGVSSGLWVPVLLGSSLMEGPRITSHHQKLLFRIPVNPLGLLRSRHRCTSREGFSTSSRSCSSSAAARGSRQRAESTWTCKRCLNPCEKCWQSWQEKLRCETNVREARESMEVMHGWRPIGMERERLEGHLSMPGWFG